jgi:hypothetical protein
MQYSNFIQITRCRYSNHQPPSCNPITYCLITIRRYSNHQPPYWNQVTLLILPTAATQTTIRLHVIQSLNSYYPLSLFNSPTLSWSPFTLLTLPAAAIQTTKPHHAVQSLYSHYPLPLFKTPTSIMRSIHYTQITQRRYSKHQPQSRNPVTLLILPTAATQTTNCHHAIQSFNPYYPLPLFNLPPPSCSPFTLLTLPAAAIQTSKPHNAVQSNYSNYQLTLFKTSNPQRAVQSLYSY